MDLISIFEQKLKSNHEPIKTVEENWDQKAKTFYQNQVIGSTYFNDAVPSLLEQKGILTPSANVLDIGSGSGRYAISLAKRCQSVHALDISSKMLEFLHQEIEKNNLDNIHTIKSPWPATEKIGEFDIAFAAMCPATRSVEALVEMSNVAKGYGVICQYTASTDSVIEVLKNEQLIKEEIKGPHNDRDLLQSYFNILWELGYEPEISYLHDTFELIMSLNEAFDTYKRRYAYLNPEQLKDILKTIQQDEDIRSVKNTTLAVISWET